MRVVVLVSLRPVLVVVRRVVRRAGCRGAYALELYPGDGGGMTSVAWAKAMHAQLVGGPLFFLHTAEWLAALLWPAVRLVVFRLVVCTGSASSCISCGLLVW